MLLKKGSRGEEVKQLQKALGVGADGIFGSGTEAVVKKFQKDNGLAVDGLVGPGTWEAIGIDTDSFEAASETEYTTKDGLVIDRQYLDKNEYVRDYGKIEPLGFFIHHTAGWNNPYKCIDQWARDSRGRIATQYVIGGPHPKTGDEKYDGVVISDYNKGFLSEDDIRFISEKHELVFLDTKKILGDYCDKVKFIKINNSEYMGSERFADKSIRDKLIVTLGSKGCMYKGETFPVIRTEVKDVAGAGDTFMAGFTVKYLQTKDIIESIKFANECATIVVQKRGVSVVGQDSIY